MSSHTLRRHWSAPVMVLAATALAGAWALVPDTQHPQPAKTAAAEIRNANGQIIGTAALTDTPAGVLLKVELASAPDGTHALHIHETGRCEGPAFDSAGGHFNPGKAQHGFEDPEGPHAGDLPNLHVPDSGRLVVESIATTVTLKAGATSLLDADGSALVLHPGADDYRSQPSGDAGTPIACGVVQAR